jgi:hypothetical protein
MTRHLPRLYEKVYKTELLPNFRSNDERIRIVNAHAAVQ